ncbi:mucin-2 [Streptomyces sp. NBC_01617]|uniref:mucin-2 n=1 Tax=Streptomyces sp. NBC_01617 TaxID=2975899 RepID=UPI003868BCED|nr:mucin-2 [Streptomyces sp. NBC_01617]
MPWFKVDDKAHSHPKFMRAGNAALGLWLRCGSYAAQHLTEGIVPGVVAQLYGTAPQAKKLVKAGLWHEHGHDCPRCPDPLDGDYVVHDFLEDGRNTSRAKYDAERKKARDRQAKHRESRTSGDESFSKTDRFEDESSSKKSESVAEKFQFSGTTAGQGHVSRRDEIVTGIHAAAAPVPNPSTSYGSTGAAAGERSGLPDQLADLKRAIAAAGLQGISWDLRESGWEYTRQAVERVGVPAMVAFAINSARLKGQPAGASAWVQGWRSLEPTPEPQDGVAYLPAVTSGLAPVGRQQQETNDLFDRAMERAKTRMQESS